MPLVVVGHEVGRREAVRDRERTPRHVDALALPQLAQHAAEHVVADARDVADARALARGGDREVRRVAAEALQVGARRRARSG